MSQNRIILEKIRGVDEVVRIPVASFADSPSFNDDLRATFDSCIHDGKTKIVVDLKGLRFPSASVIALLIEATSRLRHLHGDVKIINVARSAKSNFATFSPFSYLSLEKDEEEALREFQAVDSIHTKPDVATEDIVEDPLVDKLHDSLGNPTTEPREKRKVGEDRRRPEGVTPGGRADYQSSVDSSNENYLRVKSDPNNLYDICDFVTGFAEKVGFNVKDVGKIKIAVYEACLNTIEHAYHSNPDNWIDVAIEYDESRFSIKVHDYGVGFAGLNDSEYDVVSAMDHRQTGGFGLYIIRRSMDEVDYKSDGLKGNRLTMVKYLKREKELENI